MVPPSFFLNSEKKKIPYKAEHLAPMTLCNQTMFDKGKTLEKFNADDNDYKTEHAELHTATG